jgi:ATP-dependent Clp endopeptidase proteolytic subunit ClpP
MTTKPAQELDPVVATAQAEAITKANLEAARASRADADKTLLEIKTLKRLDAELYATDAYNLRYAYVEPVNTNSSLKCQNMLSQWHRLYPTRTIEIVFTSPGGSVVDGMALFDYIKEIQRSGHTINTHVLGVAASMAGILLQVGNTRSMAPESWLLIHEASFSSSGKIGDVEDTTEWVKKVCDRILNIFTARSTCTKAFIKKNWERRDWWVSAEDALKYGFIDEIR